MNTVAYVNAVPVEEWVAGVIGFQSAVPVEKRDGERCVPHVYPLDELQPGNPYLTVAYRDLERHLKEVQAENERLRGGAASMRAACLEVVEKEAAGYKEFNDGAAALFVVASRIAALPLAEEAALEG